MVIPWEVDQVAACRVLPSVATSLLALQLPPAVHQLLLANSHSQLVPSIDLVSSFEPRRTTIVATFE